MHIAREESLLQGRYLPKRISLFRIDVNVPMTAYAIINGICEYWIIPIDMRSLIHQGMYISTEKDQNFTSTLTIFNTSLDATLARYLCNTRL